jgi:peptide/nickel transport system substrate-binding protein
VRALDRVLTSGFYVLPLYHTPGQWVGRWKRLHRPKTLSLYGFLPSVTWNSAP